MTQRTRTDKNNSVAVALRIQSSTEPEIQTYISSLKQKYAKYLMPLEETRKIIDKAMGSKTLTGVLYETRE